MKKSFKFLNLWVENSSFMEVVRENWKEDVVGSPFVILQKKLKRVKKALASWSRETFGDIFKQIASLEDVIKVHEVEFELNPTYQNRAKHLRVK